MSPRGRTPPQWLPTPRWTIALTALAGNLLFQRCTCGQCKRLKWRDKLPELHRRRHRCRGAALAPSHIGCQRASACHGRCARPRSFPLVLDCVPAGSVGKLCVVCECATALRSTTGRRLAGAHLLLQVHAVQHGSACRQQDVSVSCSDCALSRPRVRYNDRVY